MGRSREGSMGEKQKEFEGEEGEMMMDEEMHGGIREGRKGMRGDGVEWSGHADEEGRSEGGKERRGMDGQRRAMGWDRVRAESIKADKG